MSNLLTFPSLHICELCGDELATDGKPCTDCQWEREQFISAAKRLGIFDRPAQKKKFEAYTVLVCLVAFGVLSAIGWMLR